MSDLDAGFSPGVHTMAHDCGGTWRPAREREFEARGHRWRWTELSEGSYSLLCLDPAYSQGTDNDGNSFDDVDVSQWPTDDELSAIVGVPVKFVDGGDHPDFPEGIFHTASGD